MKTLLRSTAHTMHEGDDVKCAKYDVMSDENKRYCDKLQKCYQENLTEIFIELRKEIESKGYIIKTRCHPKGRIYFTLTNGRI